MPFAAVGLDHCFGDGYGLKDLRGLVHADGSDIAAAALGTDLTFNEDIVIRQHDLDALKMRRVDACFETVLSFRP